MLTGASGFVGRHIAVELAHRGMSVRAVDRGRRSLPASVEEVIETEDIFAEGPPFWKRALEGVDIVIHAAWYVDHEDYVHSPKNIHAMAGSLRLAESTVAAKVSRFIGLGTCFEYDLTSKMPLSATSALSPTTTYGASKAGLFLALSRVFESEGVSFAWARLFYLFGEGEDPRRFTAQIRDKIKAGQPAEMSSGQQIRDYIDVSEAANLIVDLALDRTVGAVNICSGQGRSLADIAFSIAASMNRTDLVRLGALPDRVGEPPVIVGDPFIPKLREEI